MVDSGIANERNLLLYQPHLKLKQLKIAKYFWTKNCITKRQGFVHKLCHVKNDICKPPPALTRNFDTKNYLLHGSQENDL